MLFSDTVFTEQDVFEITRLNPCCNGCCSLTKHIELNGLSHGLNPCCNGCCSLTLLIVQLIRLLRLVLILVVMDAVL